MYKYLSLILVLALLNGCNETDDSKNWDLVWEDNFNGDVNTPPDPSKWVYDIGTDWGNRQLEFDTDRIENVRLDGEGNLLIVALKEDFQGSEYTSARITTKDRYDFTYGRVEARMKLPWGKGLWPAFWLLGSNIDEVSWPQCGEIDIMEYRGQEPTKIHGTIHGPGYSGSNGITDQYTKPNGRFDNEFHVFAVEWSAEEIEFFIDDFKYFTIEKDDVPTEWVYDHPFHIILNVAVGGSYVGSPNEFTVFPQTMYVDYVRVYQ